MEDYEIQGSYDNLFTHPICAERSINIFEYLDQRAKKLKTMLPTSGIENTGFTFPNSSGVFRAQFVFGTSMYSVIGSNIYKTDVNLVTTQINIVSGSVTPMATATGYVGVDANTFQVIFVDGTKGYLYDTSTGIFTPDIRNQDNSFPTSPADVTNLDNFFVVIQGGTNIFQLSSLDQGLGWGSSGSSVLQQGQVTSHPGTLIGCRTLHRRLFFFSQYYTEVWENLGLGTNLPFRRVNSALIEYGAASVGSIRVGFDKLFFLSRAKDGLGPVMMVQGVEAIPISNKALDAQLALYDATPNVGVTDATTIIIKDSGLIFYRLNFTKANVTYVYNISMSTVENPRWHEEQDLYGNRHPADTHAYFVNGINYYGDYMAPIMYFTDSGLLTNNGQIIPRIRIGKPYTPPSYQRIRCDRFHLDLLQGSALEVNMSTPEINLLQENGETILTENGVPLDLESSSVSYNNAQPQVFLSISKDGGQSYGNRLIANMGMIGNRTFRTVWRKLGTIPRGQSFVPKVEFYFSVPYVILGAAWAYEILPE